MKIFVQTNVYCEEYNMSAFENTIWRQNNKMEFRQVNDLMKNPLLSTALQYLVDFKDKIVINYQYPNHIE